MEKPPCHNLCSFSGRRHHNLIPGKYKKKIFTIITSGVRSMEILSLEECDRWNADVNQKTFQRNVFSALLLGNHRALLSSLKKLGTPSKRFLPRLEFWPSVFWNSTCNSLKPGMDAPPRETPLWPRPTPQKWSTTQGQWWGKIKVRLRIFPIYESQSGTIWQH